jgi:aspartate aminotransferase
LLDSVPTSGIIRIRDLMFSVERPYRLDQGDVSFAVPATFKAAMKAAIDADRSHYLQTAGLPRIQELLAAKLRRANAIPVESDSDVLMTSGGVHALFLSCQSMIEPGDEVIIPDPVWPQTLSSIVAAGGTPVRVPLHEGLGWRFDLDEVASRVTAKTRGLYVNSPGNPAGGVFTRADMGRLAALALEHDLWVIADEAYEDVVFDHREHVSIASLPGMYERTSSIFTFSKTYAATGLRIGYLATGHAAWRSRMTKLIGLTINNVSSVVQYGGIGVLEGDQAIVTQYRDELQARRDLFCAGIRDAAGHVFAGEPPAGAFYAFLGIDPAWKPPAGASSASRSWAMAEHLIGRGRIGCVPGIDFGPASEGYVRFCFAREREELEGALREMGKLFAQGK